jgi:hypothetical protein
MLPNLLRSDAVMVRPSWRFRASLFAIVLAIGPPTARPYGAEGPRSAHQATQRLTATATFAPRTSLQVSSQVLRFDVTEATVPAMATVEFAAGARTRHSGEVLLVVQVVDRGAVPSGPGQALTIVGGTDGMIPGGVALDAPTLAGRWAGGGLRSGRVTFRLLAPPGVYSIPVSFRLDAL